METGPSARWSNPSSRPADWLGSSRSMRASCDTEHLQMGHIAIPRQSSGAVVHIRSICILVITESPLIFSPSPSVGLLLLQTTFTKWNESGKHCVAFARQCKTLRWKSHCIILSRLTSALNGFPILCRRGCHEFHSLLGSSCWKPPPTSESCGTVLTKPHCNKYLLPLCTS